jgi:endonuclease-8
VPEGDTVFRAARTLDRALSGDILTVSDFRVPQHATADLRGLRVQGTIARGKHLLTRVGDYSVHTHLGMDGVWQTGRPGQKWRRPGYLARVILATEAAEAIAFDLKITALIPTSQEADVVGHLGPDLLGPDWDPAEAVRRLSADPDRNLGEALLDQTNLAGIGNVYRSEVLFLFGLPPTAPVSRARDLERLVTRSQQLLHANRERTERTTTGDTAPGRRTWVYGRRRGAPCLRCGTPIRREEIDGRPVYWCPSCQPA